MTLHFRIATVVDEIDAFRQISDGFIEDVSPLHELESQLASAIQAAAGARFRWGISGDRPLRTRVSDGQYEAQPRVGGEKVFAKISSVWDLEVLDFISKAKNPSQRQVALNGIASTRVELRRLLNGEDEPVALWKAEMGDEVSPGCHFHHQLVNRSSEPSDGDFPVPRLPGLFITPVAVVEFVLGELFQTEWAENVGKDRYALQRWRAIQTRHLLELLTWQRGVVQSASLGSPWTVLKAAKPDSGMVV